MRHQKTVHFTRLNQPVKVSVFWADHLSTYSVTSSTGGQVSVFRHVTPEQCVFALATYLRDDARRADAILGLMVFLEVPFTRRLIAQALRSAPDREIGSLLLGQIPALTLYADSAQ